MLALASPAGTTAPASSSSPRRPRPPTRRGAPSFSRPAPPRGMSSTPSGGPRTWDGSTPPVITSGEPGSWAHDTVSRRLREDILARVFRDNAEVLASGTIAEANLRALDAELAAAATSVITRVPPDGGPDVDTWTQLCEPHLGKTWLEAPWLFAEFYFYRRILAAIGYFDRASPAFEGRSAVTRISARGNASRAAATARRTKAALG